MAFDPLSITTIDNDCEEVSEDENDAKEDQFLANDFFFDDAENVGSKYFTKEEAQNAVDDIIENKRLEMYLDDVTSDVDRASSIGDESDFDGDEDQVIVAPENLQAAISDDDSELEDTVNLKKSYFAPAPALDPATVASDSTFTSFRISRPLLKAITDMGLSQPTPVQARTIPLALQAHDLCVSAQTGSGKTLAFLLPILERLLYRPKKTATTRILILVPTRELGVQCHTVAEKLSKYTDIKWTLCVGGLSESTQRSQLRQRPEGIIATPGRLIDHVQNSPNFGLDNIEVLVIDEADRILEDGFTDQLNEIIKATPRSRQTMLFSATMTDSVEDLMRLSLDKPIRLFVNKATTLTSHLAQEFIRVRPQKEDLRSAMLLSVCLRTYKNSVIIFFRSKASAHYMKVLFGLAGLKAAELHGNLTQAQRLASLDSFKNGESDFLLATDLASRGIDIPAVKTVINYEMPKNYSTYIHRAGRTARASASGTCVSFISEADRPILKMAVKASSIVRHRVIPAKIVDKTQKVVDGLKDKIKEVMDEEKSEKEISAADMKLKRLENISQYEEEIKMRPKKVWFQNEKEKAAATRNTKMGKEKHLKDFGLDSKSAAAPKDGIKRGPLDGLSRRKKRLRMARAEDAKEMHAQRVTAKAVKSAARPKKLYTVAEKNTKKRSAAIQKSGMFDSEKGKKKKEAVKVPEKSMSVQRGGIKKKPKSSKGAFKSKSKHKRRK